MNPRMPEPCLCLVTDRSLCSSDPVELERRVALAVRGGVDMVQLREKDLPGGLLLELAARLRKVAAGTALLVVNERVDVAMASGAGGVQLGEEGLPVEVAWRLAGEGSLIGRSVHSVEGALEAQEQGADFLVVGTIFPTGSHPGTEAAGPALLSSLAGRVGIPFLAIGGVTAENAAAVVDAGASGAAVISAILAARDPEAAARELKQVLEAAWRDRGQARQALVAPCRTAAGLGEFEETAR